MACDHGMMLKSDPADAYVDAMLMVNMQANTRIVTLLRRTAHAEVAQRWGRARGARHLLSSCDAEPACPRFRLTVLPAFVSPPA